MQTNFTYPPMPLGVDEKIIRPSAAFKTEVFKVLGTIIFFILTYFTLVGLALGFAAVCIAIAVLLVFTITKFFTIMIGLGLAGLGLMVVIFMIKFIFSRHKTDRSGLIEVTEKDQPTLFAFIRQVTRETQTPFPKRIYLSGDVNASVFYNSGFWSMFLPVRKNLQIGLGLVNSVNISEFKAILAHEFGHFSQRSMKLGSYIYNVNQVLYNLLYDNKGFERALSNWGSASGFFSIFAHLTVGVINIIQFILQKVFLLVNKSYSRLSQQMEFHADAVAAYVTGSQHLVTSLYRIEAADVCFNQLLDHYKNWEDDNLMPDNLYPQHQVVMHQLGRQLNNPVEHHFLQINAQTTSLFHQSRLVVKNQWASHPSTEDRIVHLNSLNIHSETIQEPAWSLFKDAEKLQQQMTVKMFEEVVVAWSPVVLDLTAFRDKITKEEQDYSFDAAYKGFYDSRDITIFSTTEQAQQALQEVNAPNKLEDFLTEEACRLPAQVSSWQRDVEVLQKIANGKSGIKNLDFDGKKYRAKEVENILSELTRDVSEAQQKLKQLDIQLFQFFYRQALTQGKAEQLKSLYQQLFEAMKDTEGDEKFYESIILVLHPLFTQTLALEAAAVLLDELANREKNLKKRIIKFLENSTTQDHLTEKQLVKLKVYAQAEDPIYLEGETVNEHAVSYLMEMAKVFINLSTEKAFKVKKHLLHTQLTLLNTSQLKPEY
ncbi:M48 family metallopeptidase [Adhaeribacter radiodurans]|uniref:M48 family metalloprotease n=1 Tax=Adhaeribacter radiodurans TaxID=2745197 RepID=A0A7L7L7Y3_9BACT|nr:M48 family metallopeptidase [Adhaeribacter radiodurans]QMU28854.1 M48 family metalloprotease [Adhaeribacter radiodurans]